MVDASAVDAAFLEIRTLDGPARAAALDGLADPAVRAEVASLLAFDDPAPFLRSPAPLGPDEAPIAPPILGALLADRFEVQLLAAEGGFSWVFRGYDRVAGAPVAIKLLKPASSAEGDRERGRALAREQRVLTALARASAHVVDARGMGTWQGPSGDPLPFLVMEWLDGPTLHAWLRRSAPDGMPLADAMRLLEPVAAALAAAHGEGIAHRDLKPGNIVCVGDPAAPVLRLVDFGAAKLAADRAGGFDSTTARVGAVTLDYAAPEQFDKALGPTGPRSDVYALALLLVDASGGVGPWGDLDLFARIAAILDPKARPTPRARGLEVSDPVEAVFSAALAVDPARRPPTVDALWTRLGAALDRPPPRGWRRLISRRRA